MKKDRKKNVKRNVEGIKEEKTEKEKINLISLQGFLNRITGKDKIKRPKEEKKKKKEK